MQRLGNAVLSSRASAKPTRLGLTVATRATETRRRVQAAALEYAAARVPVVARCLMDRALSMGATAACAKAPARAPAKAIVSTRKYATKHALELIPAVFVAVMERTSRAA